MSKFDSLVKLNESFLTNFWLVKLMEPISNLVNDALEYFMNFIKRQKIFNGS
jgi:hypothetical protein